MKKNITDILIFTVIILCLISIGLLIGGWGLGQFPVKNLPIYNLENQQSTSSSTASSINIPIKETKIDSLGASTEITNKIKITVLVSGKSYQISVLKDSSAYDAMVWLSLNSDESFTFEAENYSGLGYFIKSINGVKNSGGYYWTLYVNEKYSDIGASQYKLKEGDKIEWKYENL